MSQGGALYRKWRPQTFADFVGQSHVKQTIINAITSDRIAHAYLFAGPRGTGKTSLARLLAKAVNCTERAKGSGEPCGKCRNCTAFAQGNFVDLIEIDAASHTSVDDVRDLIEKVNLVPSLGKYKVYIIDEVHMLSKNAFNALLKTLEEPPAHVIFVLATTEVHKLLPTVISRCQYFDFHYLSRVEVTEQLKKVTIQEGIKITPDAIELIAENAEGSLRDALSILDQASGLGEEKIERDELAKLLGIVDNTVVQQLTQAVIDSQPLVAIELINDVYHKGFDLNQLAKQWMSYLRELLMSKLGNGQLLDRSADDKKTMLQQTTNISANQLINWLQRLVESTNTYKLTHLPQLALEMAVLKCAVPVALNVATPPTPAKPITTTPAAPPKPVATPLTSTAVKFEVAEVWPKLCAQLEVTNPATGALLKSSLARLEQDVLIVELPNDFLKNVMTKPANHQTVLSSLAELGITGIAIEYKVVKRPEAVVSEVAGVFDIM
jgi:DNA polymerase-3 subunit gamma/tau